jgi:hydrogenase large subunit
MSKRTIRLEMNRVEGDLEIKLEIDDNTVTDAWCVGKMYRGFEQLLRGRAPNDALVIAPRICGICSTSQLLAATTALEVAYQSPVAPNGTRVRNLCLMAESVLSDTRHTFLMFAPDFCNRAYRNNPLYDRAVELFEPPFRGSAARQAVQYSARILDIILAFGGQWPHSTYMLPGGVTCPLDRERLQACLGAIDSCADWYEEYVLGCSCDRWLSLQTPEGFDHWLEEKEEHANGALGVFARFGRSVGLHRTGSGVANLLSSGCYFDPQKWAPPFEGRPCLQQAGHYNNETGEVEPFSHLHVSEDVRYSWFADPGGRRHPFQSETVPDPRPGEAYSYTKASRYNDRVVQVGPLADLVMARDPLITSFFEAEGPNTWLRQFTRLHRPVLALGQMRRTVAELIRHLDEPAYVPSRPLADADGHAFVNASRGSLGHWVTIRGGKIANYQIITPTTWNASPRDSSYRRGHWEESFLGLQIKDLDDPVELGHVVRSHDACLVCTVHFLGLGRKRAFRCG